MVRSAAPGEPVAEAAAKVALTGWLRTFESLRDRNYRLYWGAMFISFFGLQMQSIAQSWLVYDITGSKLALGWVNFGSGLPIFIFSILGGVAADRMSKRALLIGSQGCIGAVTIVLGFLIVADVVQLWHIIASAFLIGIVSAFNMPARQSIVPELVGPGRLMNALALNSSSMNLSRVAAPAVGGMLIGAIGVGNVYFIKAAAYGLFMTAMAMLTLKSDRIRPRSSAYRDMISGLEYVRKEPIILTLTVMGLMSVMFGGAYQMMMPAFAKDVLHRGASGLGLLLSATGAGALLGALTVASLGNFRRKGFLQFCLGIIFGIALLLFVLVSSLGHFYLSMVVLAVIGFTSTGFWAVNNALLQTVASDEMRGRVMGVYMTTFGLQSLGVLLAGAIADRMGAPIAIAIFAVIHLITLSGMVSLRRGVLRL
ncbi:MAG: MFS transporter [Chloroflexi bacterium]|nr:MFS transporter [Chloroflexota bacterium]